MTTRITFALLALSTAAACAPEPGSFPLAAGAAATEVDLVLSPPPASVPEAATAAGHAALARVEPHSTVIWPKVDGYSDPNPIVYDQANFDRYLEICWATRRTLICGTICRQMTVGDRTVGFTTGFAYLHAGGRFHIDSLRQFLRARIARSTPEVSDAEAVKKLAEVGVPSPWVADVCASIEFIREAKASDALPELDALLSDPDENV